MQQLTAGTRKATRQDATARRVTDVRDEIATITPEIAAAWLDQNKINRKVKKSVVTKYAADMKARRWLLSFDAIRFSVDGDLLDGQHRLLACIAADTPFTSQVVYNLPAEMRSVIDTGASRSVADVLTFHDVTSPIHCASVARWVWAAKNGIGPSVGRAAISAQHVMEILARHPRIISSINISSFKTVSPSPTLLAFIHYAATNLIKVPESANGFVQVFKTGVPAYDGCPAHMLREQIVLRRRSRASSFANTERWRSMVHAWNLFAAEKTMRKFSWPKDVVMDGLDLNDL